MFYNMNLEIAAAQTLDITGPVFSDGGLWSGSTTIIFANTVSAVGLATNSAIDPFCQATPAAENRPTIFPASQLRGILR
jgi:hypothetical protein